MSMATSSMNPAGRCSYQMLAFINSDRREACRLVDPLMNDLHCQASTYISSQLKLSKFFESGSLNTTKGYEK